MKAIRDKTIEVIAGMRHGALERDEAMALSLLSAMAGESMFLLGLPGVGKSMMARRLKTAFENATVFEYLMSRFSTPDEIFGPVSISKLKDSDRYERVTTGFLPEAEVVFLDEIWKAGPAIQNSLLTVLNEKVYLNGNREMPLPLKGIIAASNELPAKDEGLEALWDRFLIRYVVEPIEKPENFIKLLLLDSGPRFRSVFHPFSQDEYNDIRNRSSGITLQDCILDCIMQLHDKMHSRANAMDPETLEVPEENARYYISDRRWLKCVGVLKTSACLNGRNCVDYSDLLLFSHMLWNDDKDIDEIRQLTAETIVAAIFKNIIDEFKSPRRHARQRKVKTDSLYSPDGKTFLIDCDGSPLKILKTDYDILTNDPKGVYFASETVDGCLLFGKEGEFAIRSGEKGHIIINGYPYSLQTVSDQELDKGFIAETGNIFDSTMDAFYKTIESNIFTGQSKTYLAVQAVAGIYRKRFMQIRH
ncbi:MAG: AAA family ATPase [Muribaculaceae bacterium]|nr:AAA family ATPase [Muribaculaceae bacterium]